jgi:hypothetical protein
MKLANSSRKKKVRAFRYFWSEYQKEYLGLKSLRTSSSSEDDLLFTLMHMQADAGGELGIEFKCLGKVMKALNNSTSTLEADPNNHKFVLSKHSTEWHISTALQTATFSVRKGSSEGFIIRKVADEMRSRGIVVLYGAFKESILVNIVSIFNTIYDSNLTLESFKSFLEGTRARRIPNAKYQKISNIDRKTYFKIVNFLEAISPGHWVMNNVDFHRIKSEKVLAHIREKILDNCDMALRMVWEDSLKKAKDYSDQVDDRRFKAETYKPCKETVSLVKIYNSKLGSLKRHKNRLPILVSDYNLHNLLRLVKKRPCPVKPYLNYIKYRPPYKIQKTKDLMESIRSHKFKVNDSLKEEALDREAEIRKMHADIKRSEERLKFSRIKAQKKEAKSKAYREKAIEQRARYTAEAERLKKKEEDRLEKLRIESERREAQRIAEIESERVRTAARIANYTPIPPLPPPRRTAGFWTILDMNRPRPNTAVSEEELEMQRSAEREAERGRAKEARAEAKKALRAELLAKAKEIALRWKNHPDPAVFLEEAIKEIKEFDGGRDKMYCAKLVVTFKKGVKETPRNEDMSNFNRL